MKTRLPALALVTVVTAAALTGCVRLGPPVSDDSEVDLSGVTGVALHTTGDVTITEGEPSLTIHAPQAVLDRLTATVRDGVLVLDRTRGTPPFGSTDIRYEISLPTLESLEVAGAGDITSSVSGDDLSIEISGTGDVDVEGLDATSVEVRLSGAGDIDLEGRADSLSVELDGLGDVDADDLEVRDAVVEISGAGDASVNATGTLRAEVSGVGSVRHRGGADVEADVSGLGEVTEED